MTVTPNRSVLPRGLGSVSPQNGLSFWTNYRLVFMPSRLFRLLTAGYIMANTPTTCLSSALQTNLLSC